MPLNGELGGVAYSKLHVEIASEDADLASCSERSKKRTF